MAERKHILLAAINAKYIHSNLAVYSLKAYAKKYQDQIGLAEYTINHQMEEIFAGIYRKKPELLLPPLLLYTKRRQFARIRRELFAINSPKTQFL